VAIVQQALGEVAAHEAGAASHYYAHRGSAAQFAITSTGAEIRRAWAALAANRCLTLQ
jgi:hypothetical protein